ncbi:hypothetical protein [Shinella sp.]|uniref:hypothetical protein n=1 Tax=Shinella sp. TaxID=1870904 RepID=UPI003F6F4D3F
MVDLSDTPAGSIARLDAALARRGEKVFFARGAGAQQEMRARVIEYSKEELVGLVDQTDRKVLLSPTSLGAYGVPKKKDRFASADEQGSVEAVRRFRMNNVLVKVELRVRVS